MKRILLIVLLSTSFFSLNILADECDNFFANLPKEQQAPFKAVQDLRKKLIELQEGNITTIEATPQNWLVSLWIKIDDNEVEFEGRILGVTITDGQQFIKFKEVGGRVLTLPVAKLIVDNTNLTRDFTVEEHRATLAKLEEVLKVGPHISFVYYFGEGELLRGIVEKVDPTNNDLKDNLFIIDDAGEESDLDTRYIDPDTIVSLQVTPQALSLDQQRLLNKLQASKSEGTYVSFLLRDPLNAAESRFEGWITDIGLNTQGAYLIELDRHGPELPFGISRHNLAHIVLGSFVKKPVLNTRGQRYDGKGVKVKVFQSSNPSYPHHNAPYTEFNQFDPATLTQMFVFSDPLKISGQNLPDGLLNVIKPGFDLRFYFEYEGTTFRLTIRQDYRTHNIIIADSSNHPNPNELNEAFRVKEGKHKERYTQSEQDLMHPINQLVPSAEKLRNHMRRIRGAFIIKLMKKHFPMSYEQWAKAIPEHIDTSEAAELLLMAEGAYFDLAKGLVKDEKVLIDKLQRKQIAAIQYLAHKGLVYYSSNALAFDVEEGIYKQGEVEVKHICCVDWGYFFGLFAAMEEAGYEYVESIKEWVEKPIF